MSSSSLGLASIPGPLGCSPAQAAHEALRVVGAAQRRDDLPRDEVPAAITAGAVELLVVLGADVLLVLEEEARLGQAATAHLEEQGEKQCRLSLGESVGRRSLLAERLLSDFVIGSHRVVTCQSSWAFGSSALDHMAFFRGRCVSLVWTPRHGFAHNSVATDVYSLGTVDIVQSFQHTEFQSLGTLDIPWSWWCRESEKATLIEKKNPLGDCYMLDQVKSNVEMPAPNS